MRRDSLNSKIERRSRAAKFLWECRECHTVGLRPEMLETPVGKRLTRWGSYYGVTLEEIQSYSELSLNEQGLCEVCAEQLGASH
jgi:ribosomal protein L37AE/L43A